MQDWQNSSDSSSHPVIFDSLKSLPDDSKMPEALGILIAGADTTAATLTTGFYHILSNLECKERIVRVLDEVMPEPGSLIALRSLEKVEYLVCGDHVDKYCQYTT